MKLNSISYLLLIVNVLGCGSLVAQPLAEGVTLPQTLSSVELRFSLDNKKLIATRNYTAGSSPLVTIHDLRTEPNQGRAVYFPLVYPDLYNKDNTLISSRKKGIFAELSNDGNILATTSYKIVRLWDIGKDGKFGWWPPKPISVDLPGSAMTTFLNGGKQLLSVSALEKANPRADFAKLEFKLWEVSSGKPIGDPVVSTGSEKLYSPTLKCLAFAPDETFFLVAVGNHQKDAQFVQFWDTKTLKPIGEPLPAIGSVYRFGPDGKTFISISKGEIALWDIATRKVVCMLPTPEVAKYEPSPVYNYQSLPWYAIHPNGKSVLYRKDKSAMWCDLSGEKPVVKVTLKHPGNVYWIALSKDGKRAATVCDEQDKVIIWDLETGKAILIVPNKNRIVAMEFSPDGKQLATADTADIHIWKIEAKGN